jgi:putative ABC transport system permease protein
VKSLDKKALRELWHMKGQALAIAMVIGSGVGTFVMSLATLESLQSTRTAFYEQYRFADVFANLTRAPESLRGLVAQIPGVDLVDDRVVASVLIDVPNFPDPVTGRLISIDEDTGSLLNAPMLREGRMPDPLHADEVLVAQAFAQAHDFALGDHLYATIKGRRQELTMVGTALSPEFIYMIAPGATFPDFERYGVLWMNREPLANAYEMEGAFNDISLRLSAGASEEDVIDRLDLIIDRYGGRGAYGRAHQISHRFLSEEFRQLRLMATVFPVIFLSVAAFLINVVISRVIRTQREQVATLKAFGYTSFEVFVHYGKLIFLIVVLGVVVGLGIGIWLGHVMAQMYMEIYKFPYLRFTLPPWVVAASAAVSLVAALTGAGYSVYQAVRQPPAQAMRPEAPAVYRETILERLGLKRFMAQPTRMIFRHIERQPVKSGLTMLGIAFSVAILMTGLFFTDAVNLMIDVYFGLGHREDVAVYFTEPTSHRAYFDLLSLPGVQYAEPFRAVAVDVRNGHRSYRTSIQGLEPGTDLVRLIDTSLEPVPIPPDGLVLTSYLADILGARTGDELLLEVREGSRPVRQVPLVAQVSEYIGVSAYMDRDALNRLMREGDAISGAYLAIDAPRRDEVLGALEGMPRVAGTSDKSKSIEAFYETVGNQLLTWALINTFLAGSIAVGVVYNSARIALAERSRELASLRVLGFRRAEVSYILLGELTVLTLVAIPVGFIIGRALCAYMVHTFQTDLFRVPVFIEPSTYSYAAGVVLVASVISGLIVRRRVDHLDLVAVLKTRE